ncbi:MAG: hypothetical protein ACXWZ7_10570, partial [Gemmatirosa sp.]
RAVNRVNMRGIAREPIVNTTRASHASGGATLARRAVSKGHAGDVGMKPHSSRCVWHSDVDPPTSPQCRTHAVRSRRAVRPAPAPAAVQ